MEDLDKKSYKPPKGVQSNAKRGLEMRERYGRGGLSTQEAGRQGIRSGVARARDLANGKSLSLQTIRRMRAFFERHERNKDSRTESGEPGAGAIAWLLWGGDAGRRWANGVLRQEGVLKFSHEGPRDIREHSSDSEDIFFQDDAYSDSENTDLTEGDAVVSNAGGMTDSFQLHCEVAKVHDELGLVFGWAIICKEMGQPYFDLQGDHIPEHSMLKAATNFAKGARVAREMHVSGDRGTVVFMLPFTGEIAKSLGIQSPDRTGLIIGMAPDDDMLEKFKTGELRGFSIGGKRLKDVPA